MKKIKKYFVKTILFISLIVNVIFLFNSINGCKSYPFSQKWTSTDYSKTRYLIITADDFCCSVCIDSGSILGVKDGIINTLTAITTYPNAASIIKSTKEKYPLVHIGIHLNITTGSALSPREKIPSLIDKDGQFYDITDELGRLDKISLNEVEIELRAQIEEFLKSGVEIDHFSYQHNLLALYPPFYDIVIKLAKEYNVPVRNPVSLSVIDKDKFPNSGTRQVAKQLVTKLALKHPFKALGLIKYAKEETMLENIKKLDNAKIKHPDYMIDYLFGNPTPENLIYILNNLPEGTSELIFHLGFNCESDKASKGIDTNYFPLREMETVLATSSFIKEYIKNMNIKIIYFSDLTK